MPFEIKRSVREYPYTCLHPQRVFNRNTHEWMFVPCGKCSFCLNSKSSLLSSRVSREVSQNKYSFFFTLTYDNVHIPRIAVSDIPFGDNPCMFATPRPERGRRVNFVTARSVDDFGFGFYPHPIERDFSPVPSFGYLSVSDIQKFVKRFRNNIIKHTHDIISNSFRYFIAGEYGPRTHRPHYHGILFTDSDFVASHIEQLLSASWPFDSPDRHKVSLVGEGAPQYVASYVNSLNDLPRLLSYRAFRPFVLASKNPLIGFKTADRETVRWRVYRNDFTERILDNNTAEVILTSYPKQIVDRYFHKFPYSSELSFKDRVHLYDASRWQDFFKGRKDVFASAFVDRFLHDDNPYRVRFKTPFWDDPIPNCDLYGYCCMRYNQGVPLNYLLRKYYYPVYQALLCAHIETPLWCKFAGLKPDVSEYVRLLDRIDTAYFNISMGKFYELQDNYVRSGHKSVYRFYPNLIDMLTNGDDCTSYNALYTANKHLYDPYLSLPDDSYHLDMYALFFPDDDVYRHEEALQQRNYDARSKFKKYNDSRLSQIDLFNPQYY